jgi:mannosyl-oligosaccharide alpha-1,2-mannosidase
MLPSYNDNAVQRSLSKLAGKESLLGRRPMVRWIVLGCVILGVFVFFAQPFSIPTFDPSDVDGPWAPPPPGPPPPAPHGAPHGGPPPPPRPGHLPPPRPPPHGGLSPVWDERKEEVRQTYLHAWNGYLTKAFPNDEVLPLSGRTSNK